MAILEGFQQLIEELNSEQTFLNEAIPAAIKTDSKKVIIKNNIVTGVTKKDILGVIIPDGVTAISDSAFFDCSRLMSVTIPASVTSIGDSAFEECSRLVGVTIPASVTSINNRSFAYCGNLHSVIFKGNSITSIGNYAFAGCSGLTSIIIPDGVTSIGKYVFYNCTSLTSVTIPDSVTSVSDFAFYNCSNLTEINFTGTKAQWLNIPWNTNGSRWNVHTGKYIVHCIDGDLDSNSVNESLKKELIEATNLDEAVDPQNNYNDFCDVLDIDSLQGKVQHVDFNNGFLYFFTNRLSKKDFKDWVTKLFNDAIKNSYKQNIISKEKYKEILDNIKNLAETFKTGTIRLFVVKAIKDANENIKDFAYSYDRKAFTDYKDQLTKKLNLQGTDGESADGDLQKEEQELQSVLKI